MNKLPNWILATIAASLSFNFAYTLFSILLRPVLPPGLINGTKYGLYVLLVASLVLSLIYKFRQGGQALKKPPRYVLLAIGVMAWSVVTFAYSQASLWQSARGFSVDFSGLILLLAIWLWQPSQKEISKVIYVILGVLSGLAVLSIPEIFFNHSYRLWAGHDLERHYIQQRLPQLQSLASGPNPFGTLLTIFSALAVWKAKNHRWFLVLLLAIGVLMGLTYARSAWLGVGILGAGMFFAALRRRQLLKWPAVLALSILLGASLGALRYQESIVNVLTHGQSTDQHGQIAKKAVDETTARTFQASLFGFGIGTAGPVVYNTAEAEKGNFIKITENWYLQLTEEIGLIGLIIYLWLYYEIVRRLFKQGQILIGWLAIGLAVNAMFLHTWSTDVNLNLFFWVVAAIALLPGSRLKPAYEPNS